MVQIKVYSYIGLLVITVNIPNTLILKRTLYPQVLIKPPEAIKVIKPIRLPTVPSKERPPSAAIGERDV